MSIDEITIVICCAGMGTRLGISTTKALVNISGKPLIIRQLELLKDYNDIRIVVGYQAERVIKTVNEYRKDIMFAFNYFFDSTGVGTSLLKGIVGARKYIVAIDGDLLINPEDFQLFMEYPDECLGASEPKSDEPVYMILDKDKRVIEFSNKGGVVEWSGIAKLKSRNISLLTEKEHIYEMLKPLLPLPSVRIRSREVDTPEDYEKMIEWIDKGYKE